MILIRKVWTHGTPPQNCMTCTTLVRRPCSLTQGRPAHLWRTHIWECARPWPNRVCTQLMSTTSPKHSWTNIYGLSISCMFMETSSRLMLEVNVHTMANKGCKCCTQGTFCTSTGIWAEHCACWWFEFAHLGGVSVLLTRQHLCVTFCIISCWHLGYAMGVCVPTIGMCPFGCGQ